MSDENSRKLTIKLTEYAAGVAWWMFNDRSSGVQAKGRLDVKRIKRIVRALRQSVFNEDRTSLMAGEITIGFKDMKFLREKGIALLDGLSAAYAEGMDDLLEACDEAEDRMNAERVKAGQENGSGSSQE